MLEPQADHMREPVVAHMRTDFPLLDRDLTIGQALEVILQRGVGERVVYFYVVDEAQRLVGVMPTRRLLMTPRDRRVGDLMVRDVVSISHTATVYDVCKQFVTSKFLAYPVVDEDRRVLGVVDVNLFTDEIVDMADRDRLADIFETIGLRIAHVRNASPFRAFRYRFPWLLTTITSGIVCAFLAGAFGATLAESLIIAFFLTLVLGLGESVSMQSMTLAIQTLHGLKPSAKWYARALRKEVLSGVLLGAACGLLTAITAWLWQQDAVAAGVIGLGIALSMLMACAIGLTIPSALHALRLDPKIAAGPVTLALTDICTLLFYFGLARAVL